MFVRSYKQDAPRVRGAIVRVPRIDAVDARNFPTGKLTGECAFSGRIPRVGRDARNTVPMVVFRRAIATIWTILRDMPDRYRLHYAPDNASLIIRLALEALHAPYETALVDRRLRAHKSDAYLRLNPNGLIPVLETPDGPFFETGAILLWLADRHGALAPAPDDPSRAGFLKWLFFLSNTLHPALRLIFCPDQYVGADKTAQRRLRRYMQAEISRHLDALEALAGDDCPWFGAARPSALDLYLGCCLRWLALYPQEDFAWFDLHNWPRLRALARRLDHCDAARAAIHAEGLGPSAFSAPIHATPPEGSAT